MDIYKMIFEASPELSRYPKDIALIRFINQELDKYNSRLEFGHLLRLAIKEYQQYNPKRTTEEAFEVEVLQYRELVKMSMRLGDIERDNKRKSHSIELLKAENKRLNELAEGMRKMIRYFTDASEIQNFLN